MVQLSTPGVTLNRGMGDFCQITLTSCFNTKPHGNILTGNPANDGVECRWVG